MKRASKILSLLLVAIVALAFLPGVAHADPPQDDPSHRHSWSVVSEKKATCTENGSKTWKCSACGKTYTEKTKAKGHRWDDGAVTTPATCTADGVLTYTCIRCKATKTEAIPMTGHTAVTVPARAATCEEAGLTEGSQCSVCGEWLTAQQTVPALGHDWDEGKVTTPPSGFTPGEKTFTCARCGATRTEPVDPTASLFTGMSTVIPDFSGGTWLMNNPVDPLHITQQPQGGVATGDSPLVLTVEAAGGEGAYTYHWYREPALPTTGGSMLAEIVASQASAVTTVCHEAQTATSSGLTAFQQAWWKQHGISGTIEKPTAATGTESMSIQTFNHGQEYLGTSDDPKCYGYSGYRYWCVVEDEAGHKAASNKAEVGEGLHIVRQPENMNIYGRDSVTLICVAAGGSSPDQQLYNWYDANGNLLSDGSTYMATTTGDYYCKVYDFGTDEIVDSLPAQVYSEEVDLRPTITKQPESITLEYREDGQYSWSMTCQAEAFDGSSEDLKYEWQRKYSWLGWMPIGEGETYNSSSSGATYRCKVTDKRNGGYIFSNKVTVSTELVVSDVKNGDSSDGLQNFMIYVQGGNAPYTIKIYKWCQILRPNEDGWDWKAILYREYTIEDKSQLAPLTVELPQGELQYYRKDGVLKLGKARTWYYIEVIDANRNYVRYDDVYSD